ncbi:MAG: ATP-binding protein [bacterium]
MKELQRTTFKTSRLLEYFSEKELTMQIGHTRLMWPIALLKELIDNALDACEGAGVQPVIEVTIEDDSVLVRDNGPGIPRATIEKSLDYIYRVSDKTNYVSPSRGQLGNALKCVWAAPYVVNGEYGRVDVEVGGEIHRIKVILDRVAQEPRIDHHVETGNVKKGTLVRIHWDGIASYLNADESVDFYNDEDSEDDDPFDSPDVSDLISTHELISRYAAFNPHATFILNSETISEPMKGTWRKWRSNECTSAQWYDAERLRNLIAAYVTEERDGGSAKTVREFVSEFRGFTSTVKQKCVTEASGLSGLYLHDLVNGDGVDIHRVETLLDVMKQNSKPVNPRLLGIIGQEWITDWMASKSYVDSQSVRYKKILATNENGLPFVLEIGLGIYCSKHEGRGRTLAVGLNWTPVLADIPCREISEALQAARVDKHDPVCVAIHIACPRLEFTGHGKGQIRL